ncbi:MAG TPA: ABC transporter permease [Chitinophagaceae bacterium]|nr:ABC transporter permease [Chitinophagaceae bacterium]
MFRNYLKTAWRNLWRSPLYVTTNIAGLSLGFACVMLIMLYVKDDLSFDRFHAAAGNIYRIVHEGKEPDGKLNYGSSTSGLEAVVFKEHVREIRSACRFMGGSDELVAKGNEVFSEQVDYADPNFFTFFSFKLLHGQASAVLDQPNKVVISEEMALKYFGDVNAVGKILRIFQNGNFENFMVSGISAQSPLNSSLRFNILLPISRVLQQDYTMQWFMGILNTFVLLDDKTNVSAVESKIQSVFENQAKEKLAAIRTEFGNFSFNYKLQPLTGIHRDKVYTSGNGIRDWNDPQYSFILSGIAFFILAIACINFINQNLARLLKRAKEVGIRKVIGGSRGQLILQFIGESFLLNLLAFIPAFLIVYLALPLFTSVANKQLEASYLFQLDTLALFLALIVVNALLAGLYPALSFARFNPTRTLAGNVRLSGRGTLGKSLLVVQFVISICLIAGTIVMQKQFDYMMNKNLGFNAAGVVNVQLPYINPPDIALFKNELAKQRHVQFAGAQSIPITAENKMDVKAGSENIPGVPFLKVDNNFLQVMQIPVIAGRNFKDHLSDSANCMVNASFVKAARWNVPLGKKIEWGGQELTVVGVVPDFHIASLKNAIGPVLLNQPKQWVYGELAVKIDPRYKAEAIAGLQSVYKSLVPLYPFRYRFVDELISAQYKNEERWKKVITGAAIVSVFISCIGLFALFSLAIEQRAKEISIRKVMGSGAANIFGLLSRGFFYIILIASLIAVPFSAWIMQRWLESFAYRIQLPWWIFLVACVLTLVIGFVTISLQTLRAAMIKPVENLRAE